MADLKIKSGFDPEDLVSGSSTVRQSIRSMAKGVHTNFQLSSVVLKLRVFFAKFGILSRRLLGALVYHSNRLVTADLAVISRDFEKSAKFSKNRDAKKSR